jgi:RND family efflux transporter MFP subunit
MFRKYFLPVLSILGALLGLFVVFWSQKTVPTPPIFLAPPRSPYLNAIAGAGIIESSSQNISIGTPFNEIIDKIYVVEGDYVKTGDILFQLDLRNFNAQADVARESLKAALTDLEDKATQFAFYERLKDKQAVSEQIYEQYRYAFLQAQDAVNVAKSNLEVAETNIRRSIIRAPCDGRILQVNIHVGEIAPVIPSINGQSSWQTAAQGSLLLMGIVDPMQVRIDIDEDDAWRYEFGAQAMAFVRGNSRISFQLTFQRIEPFIIPKSSFTGKTTERVDTRVLQVLYNFEKKDLPIYVGQVLDIFIESQPIQYCEVKS